MKKLEKRVERELVDILYSIIKSRTYIPSSGITINLNEGIKVKIFEVMTVEYLFPLYSVMIINEQNVLLARTTLIINPYEAGYTIKYITFDKKQRLKEKRWLVERLKK